MIYSGQNPQELTYPEELLPKSILAQQYVRGSYPPWSYLTSIALVPPVGWTAARFYFAAINSICIGAIALWAYRIGARISKTEALIATVSAVSIFSICLSLSYGQYSVFVVACLVACLILLERKQFAVAGLFLGLAAVKPQLAGLFFFVPALYPYSLSQKIRFFAPAMAYLAVASWGIALLVDASPWSMLRQTFTESGKYYNLSNNPLLLWSASALGFPLGSKSLALTLAACCASLLLLIRRNRDLMAGFSICAIFSLYWSYSRHYDLVILSIPLTQLLLLWRNQRSATAGVAFLGLGLMLWLPIRIGMSRWPSVQFMLASTCVISVAVIAIHAFHDRKKILATDVLSEGDDHQVQCRTWRMLR
jgi:hypothetical protein